MYVSFRTAFLTYQKMVHRMGFRLKPGRRIVLVYSEPQAAETVGFIFNTRSLFFENLTTAKTSSSSSEDCDESMFSRHLQLIRNIRSLFIFLPYFAHDVYCSTISIQNELSPSAMRPPRRYGCSQHADMVVSSEPLISRFK